MEMVVRLDWLGDDNKNFLYMFSLDSNFSKKRCSVSLESTTMETVWKRTNSICHECICTGNSAAY